VEAPGELLQGEVIADRQEGGEGLQVGDPCPYAVIVVVKTPQDIEHQDLVTKSISLALHLPAELTHGKITLLEGAEISIELESLALDVAEDLALERQPGLVRGAVVNPADVLEMVPKI
jgi:hypothetical protein